MDEAPENDDPKKEEFVTYCTLLGGFFHSYTALEHELALSIYAAVTRFTKRPTRRNVLVAVLGGQRMAPLKDTVNRLLRATKAPPKRIKWVEAIFLQLGEIQFFRDKLAHNFTAATDEPDVWENMNFAGIREPSKMEDIRFHVLALDAAALDLANMRHLAGNIFSHYVRLPGESAKLPPLPTWLYKASMLTRDRPLSGGNRPQRKRPSPLSKRKK